MTRERIAALPEDDWRRRSDDFREPLLSRNLELQHLFAHIGAPHGHSAAVVALAWALRRPEVTGAIVGARSAAQVDGFEAALTFRLSSDELAQIDAHWSAQDR
jgi:aryl-alcohol dehydrogenase-like predicted oxidoreductase